MGEYLLVIIGTVISTILMLLVMIVLAKQFKYKSLLTSVMMATLPPPATAIIQDFNRSPEVTSLKPSQIHQLKTNFQTPPWDICVKISNAWQQMNQKY